MKHKSLLIAGLIIAVLCIAVLGVLWDINRDVNKYIQIAQKAHPVESDDVAALINYVNSEEHSLQARNHAVWTLGRIGDKRAAAALKPYYTGQICRHTKGLCQKELNKAIARCEK